MRYWIRWILMLLVVVAGICPGYSASITLTKNKKSNTVIMVSASAKETESQAAKDLQHYLNKISGVEFPLKIDDGQPISGVVLNIGKTSLSLSDDLPTDIHHPESFAIKARENGIFFQGNTAKTTANAVYTWLQQQFGVRWFAPGEDWEFIPSIAVPDTWQVEVEDQVKSPDISPRIWSGHQWNDQWKLWNLRNNTVRSEKVTRRHFQNNMYRIFPPSKYAERYPEYYPLIEGKRWIPSNNQYPYWWPCFSNPDVEKLTVQYIREYFDKNPQEDSFSLGMDDIEYFCSCEQCLLKDAATTDYENKQFSTRYYNFVNKIARAVKKTHPDKYIGTLIYREVLELPQGIEKMEDNVFGYLAGGSAAEWYIPGQKEKWIQLTRGWKEKVRYLSRYEYLGLSSPVPRFFPHTLDEAIKFDRSLGFEGMYMEIYTFLPQTAPMIWAAAQLQADAGQNIDQLLGEFYQSMFPTSHLEVKQYFELMESSWNVMRPGREGWVHRNLVRQALSISAGDADKGLLLLNQAYGKATTTLERRRIDVIRGGHQFGSYPVWIYHLANRVAVADASSMGQSQQLIEDLISLARIIEERKIFWDHTLGREDMLGENARAFNKSNVPGRQPSLKADFSILQNPALQGIYRLIDWYRQRDANWKERLDEEFMSRLPDGYIKYNAQALIRIVFSEQQKAPNRLKNGDFEIYLGPENNSIAHTFGIPVEWSMWSRKGQGNSQPTRGRLDSQYAVRLTSPTNGEAVSLMQDVEVRPRQQYVVSAWVKIGEDTDASNVALTVRFKHAGGWVTSPNSAVKSHAGPTTGWQQVFSVIDIPQNAQVMTIMLGVSRKSVGEFDDIKLYLLNDG